MLLSKKNIILLLFAYFVCYSCKSNQEITEAHSIEDIHKYAFNFVSANSLSPILDKAAAEGKLVFVDIYTDWCLPCKMMDEDVFTHISTADIINRDFISYKVNAEKVNGPDLAALFEVKAYPTLLFLDTKGRVLERKSGAAYHSELLTMAENAIAKRPVQSSNYK